MYKCKICNTEFKDQKSLHQHISKEEKTRLAQYYHTYYPKYDKLTGKIIPFKSFEYYFNNDFTDRSNFVKWLSQNIKTREAKKYCYNKLKERIEKKDLTYTPCHAELKTLQMPNIIGYEALGGIDNYLKFCDSFGLVNRFEYNKKRIRNNNKEIEIIVDTRERSPFSFDSKTINKKLDFGDYSVEGSYLSIERKSMSDLAGTLTTGFDRFCREIERSGYLIVLVEETAEYVMNFTPDYKWSNKSKIRGSFICNRIRGLLQTYDNLQFLFANGKDEGALLCKKILTMNPDKVKTLDLQWLHDLKLLL